MNTPRLLVSLVGTLSTRALKYLVRDLEGASEEELVLLRQFAKAEQLDRQNKDTHENRRDQSIAYGQ
jgi:hypothetical protein